MTSENIPIGNEPEVENLEFTRENIEKNKQIRLVDTDDATKLELFSYINCESTDSELVKQCRGTVFHGDQIIMKGFPFTNEYNDFDDIEEIKKNVDFDQHTFYDSYEGALIRMFYFADKWFISTNRKLDAFRSKWASKESFGSFFKKALQYEFEYNERLIEHVEYDPSTDSENVIEIFQDKVLDKTKQYMFLLLNNSENRIVCESPTNPTLYHVGTFIDHKLINGDDVFISHPRRLEFNNIDELLSYVTNLNYNKLQGIIAFNNENTQFKILNKDYQYLYKARGNEPSIKFRYLQVRMDKNANDSLRYLYPESCPDFEKYEGIIFSIAESITKSYIERFIKKNYVTVPSEEFHVIRQCHSWHIENRLENKINLHKVIEILNAQPPTNINRMIKRKILDEKEKLNPENAERSINNNNTRTTNFKKQRKEYVSILTKKPVISQI
jgi:hypothetical protein